MLVRRMIAALALAASPCALASCTAVAGIDDRTLDPTFAPGASTSSECATYCAAIGAGCADPRLQYISSSACVAFCAAFPAGTSDNPTGNTTSCRSDRAVKARDTGEPQQYCSSAGPAGFDSSVAANACGTACDAYCTLEQKICPAQFASVFVGQIAQCKAACSAIPDKGSFDVGTANQTGNSLQCRLYHLQAATAAPEDHCPHTVGLPGKQAVAPCAD